MTSLEQRLTKVQNDSLKVPCFVSDTKEEASQVIAEYICERINEKQKNDQEPFVLGLATGSTPIPIYQALIKLFNEKKVSFSKVITINLDEYYPIEENDHNSYHYFMNNNLFKHVDFDEKNNNIPSGTTSNEQIDEHCEQYEQIIRKYGIDIQILGIGRSGHIGFNEPGSGKVNHNLVLYYIFTT